MVSELLYDYRFYRIFHPNQIKLGQHRKLHGPDFLFIGNVGNLPFLWSYDLGQDLRVVLLSVTEGGQGAQVPDHLSYCRRGRGH